MPSNQVIDGPHKPIMNGGTWDHLEKAGNLKMLGEIVKQKTQPITRRHYIYGSLKLVVQEKLGFRGLRGMACGGGGGLVTQDRLEEAGWPFR